MPDIVAGSTNQTIDVFIQDSSATDGSGLTGLVFNSAGLTCYYRRGATGTSTQLALATQTVGGAHSDGGFVEIHATQMNGTYRLDLSDAVVAAGVPYVTIVLQGATNMAPTLVRLDLPVFDKFNSGWTDFNTIVSNAHVDTADGDGGGSNTIALGTDADGVAVNELRWRKIKTLSGAGSGQERVIVSNTVGPNSVATVDENWAVAVDATTVYSIGETANARLINSSHGGASASVQYGGGITADVTGDLSGSVGSVTGAVGSVTGAVGSVTGAVGSVSGNVDGNVTGSVGSVVGHTAQTGDSFARLGAPAGASVSADVAAVQADTDDIQTRLPAALVGGRMDSDVGNMQTDVISAAALSQAAADKIIQQVSGTADSGTVNTLVDAARTEADTDYWKDSVLLITSGTIAGQVRRISAFNPATDTITVDMDFTQAVGTNTYMILRTAYVGSGSGGDSAGAIADQVWVEALADHSGTAGSTAERLSRLPDANADAAGGLPISDAGGLDMDAILSRIGTMTDLGGGADIANNLADIAGSGFVTGTDSLAAMESAMNPSLLQSTTIATLASQTSFTLTAGSADNDAYNGAIAIVTDSATATQKAVGLISDYVGSTRTVTLRTDPGIFTMGVGDAIDVVAGPRPTVDDLLNLTDGIETSYTVKQALRLILSASCAELAGAATSTVTIRDVNDTANRIVATVDGDGNRSAVTLTPDA